MRIGRIVAPVWDAPQQSSSLLDTGGSEVRKEVQANDCFYSKAEAYSDKYRQPCILGYSLGVVKGVPVVVFLAFALYSLPMLLGMTVKPCA